MLHDTPLRERHEEYSRRLQEASGPVADPSQRPGAAQGKRTVVSAIEYIPYGLDSSGAATSGAGGANEVPSPACEVVAAYGEVEPEYAAIRRPGGAGIMDCPQFGTIRITGAERREFLNRMVTQELKDLGAGEARRTFWLNRKGRIDADLTLIELGDELLAALDIHQAASAVASLGEFVFAEQVELADVSAQFHHLAIHGPASSDVIAAASGEHGLSLDPGRAARVTIAGAPCVVWPANETGGAGCRVIAPYAQAAQVWDALLATDATVGGGKRRVRPVGWHAYNIARIESGTPLMNIDFGATNLPHESGVLHERVSFTKGCYLGQEIVARMESLGRPKQMLVGLKMTADLLPVAGAQVFRRVESGPSTMGPEIGAVTSSTLAPMLGAQPIAFAMLRTADAAPGVRVLVNAEGQQVEATAQGLAFYAGAPAAAAQGGRGA